jgi:hypothetical protein
LSTCNKYLYKTLYTFNHLLELEQFFGSLGIPQLVQYFKDQAINLSTMLSWKNPGRNLKNIGIAQEGIYLTFKYFFFLMFFYPSKLFFHIVFDILIICYIDNVIKTII